MAGVFIAFEGGEGAGKSTQSTLLAEALLRQDYRVVPIREPGSTPLGDYLRNYLIGDLPVSDIAELLMFEASRAELVAERIRPELETGAVVICDRFAGSTIAYQGYGRGLDLEKINLLNNLATDGLYPDMTILLDIDPAIGLERVNNRLFQLALPMGDAPDRFEEETMAFHERVRRGFLRQAERNLDTWKRIDANHSIDTVAAAIWAVVNPLLPSQDLRLETG